MHIYTFYLVIFAKLTQSYKILIPKLPMKQCLSLTLHQGQYHTLFIDGNNDTDSLLKDCIIKKIHENQSLLLTKGLKSYSEKGQFVTHMPNMIFMIKSLNQDLLESFSAYEDLKFHWNMFYIAVTADDGTYKCKDGKFDEMTFHIIQNFMNDVWHKFEIARVILVFPNSCAHTYVIYDAKLLTDKPLYNRTVKVIRPKTFSELSTAIIKSSDGLMHGYPITASIFERFPTSLTQCDKVHYYLKFNSTVTNGFCGTDGLIMYETIKYFNFNVTFSQEKECNTYGYVNCENHVVTGSLGCILNKKVDVSFNSRFMVAYTEEFFNFLHYVSHDKLCALLPVPDIYPLWHYPHMPMNVYLWMLIITTVLILAGMTWMSAAIIKKRTNEETPTFKTCISDITTCTLFGFSLKKYSRFYFLRGLCLWCSIILLAYYQGYINYTFTTLKHFNKIKTLQELYESNYVLYTSPAVRELLKSLENHDNTKQEDFLNRTKLQHGTDIGIVLEHNNAVTLGRNFDAHSEILLRYRNNQGKPRIYVVNECFCQYYLSYISSYGFIFAKDLKIFMERLVEAGIPSTFYKWTRRTLGLPDYLPKYGPEPRPTAKIRIGDQRIPIALLVVGYLVSTLSFLVEKWLNRRNIFIVLTNIIKFKSC